MRHRFAHLNDLERLTSRDDPNFGRWADVRLDRWLVDWALRNGKINTARSISEEKGIGVSFLLHMTSNVYRLIASTATRRH